MRDPLICPKPIMSKRSKDPSLACAQGRRLGYARVSDNDQTEALQLDALAAAKCDEVFTDHGVSGANRSRPALDRILADLRPNDTLVVWKLDRLGRSTIHLLEILSDLRQRDIDFIALTQGIDTTTAVGRMLFGQLAVFAEFEREQISDRTKAGMAAAKKRGQHLGRPNCLSQCQMAMISKEIAEGGVTIKGIAARYQISPQTVSRALVKAGQLSQSNSI
jgi:DNA invertase Pin-like site-specific DNA recombinase